MKRRFWNISVALLYGVLIVLMIQLYFTADLRNAYAQALTLEEEQIKEELKRRVGYLNSQVPYIRCPENQIELDLKYCESLSCIDSLERHFQEELTYHTIEKSNSFPFLYSETFSHWDTLKALYRLEPLVDIFDSELSAHSYLLFNHFVVMKGVFTEPFIGHEDYYHPWLFNNTISINDGPFIKGKPFSSQWFTVPHSDTLKLTYFKDNYSYGYGRDSIIKRYVYDISHLKPG